MLLGLMITSSLHLYRFGRSGRLPPGTRHRYPESIRMVSSRRHVHSFIRPDGTFWQHRRRSLNGRNGRQHVVTMGDIIPMTLSTVFLHHAPYTDEEWEVCHTSSGWTPTGIPLSSTARSVTRPIGIATQMPPSDRPSFP
jgi:hypothetical protein